MHKRYYFSCSIADIFKLSIDEIIGALTNRSEFNIELPQRCAWTEQIEILKSNLNETVGSLYFEYSIPRMGRRIDVVAIIQNVIFVLEFKVGEASIQQSSVDQVWDYA